MTQALCTNGALPYRLSVRRTPVEDKFYINSTKPACQTCGKVFQEHRFAKDNDNKITNFCTVCMKHIENSSPCNVVIKLVKGVSIRECKKCSCRTIETTFHPIQGQVCKKVIKKLDCVRVNRKKEFELALLFQTQNVKNNDLTPRELDEFLDETEEFTVTRYR